MKIVDTFLFYNEIDLLKYRLAILEKVVDHFIIVESTHTYSGKEKPLFFEENREMFEAYMPKIVHVVVSDFPFKYPAIDYSKRQQWVNENHQRNCISRGIDKLDLVDNDILLISDLDEIPDPNILVNIQSGVIPVTLQSLEQDLYYYNLRTRVKKGWAYATVLQYSQYKRKPQPSSFRCANAPRIKASGWHLSYFGDSSFIANKIHNFSHQEYNHDTFTNTNNIEQAIANGTDLYRRESVAFESIPIETNQYLPPRYDEFLTRFI